MKRTISILLLALSAASSARAESAEIRFEIALMMPSHKSVPAPAAPTAPSPVTAPVAQVPEVPQSEPSVKFIPVVPSAPKGPSLFDKSFLQAIRMVETGDSPRKIGTSGERGAYQFMYSTWRQHTRLAFRRAHTGAAHAVAQEHLEWLRAELVAMGLPASSYNLALCWNAGVTAVRSGRLERRHHDYATRVSNLAGDLLVAAN